MGPREAGPGHWERVGKGARLASTAHLQWHGGHPGLQRGSQSLDPSLVLAPMESRGWPSISWVCEDEQGVTVSECVLGCGCHICEMTTAAPDSKLVGLCPPPKLRGFGSFQPPDRQCPAHCRPGLGFMAGIELGHPWDSQPHDPQSRSDQSLRPCPLPVWDQGPTTDEGSRGLWRPHPTWPRPGFLKPQFQLRSHMESY